MMMAGRPLAGCSRAVAATEEPGAAAAAVWVEGRRSAGLGLAPHLLLETKGGSSARLSVRWGRGTAVVVHACSQHTRTRS